MDTFFFLLFVPTCLTNTIQSIGRYECTYYTYIPMRMSLSCVKNKNTTEMAVKNFVFQDREKKEWRSC